jgi:hypothetical protein
MGELVGGETGVAGNTVIGNGVGAGSGANEALVEVGESIKASQGNEQGFSGVIGRGSIVEGIV